MNIIIRRGEETDFPQVVDLIREFAAFQGTPDKVQVTAETMRREQGLFICLVAEQTAGNIVGFATFFFCFYSWSGKNIYMDDLYVQPEKRGQGIGTALLTAVRTVAEQEHCTKMKWQVSNWNKPAIGFYKSLGAAIDEVEINCELNLQHEPSFLPGVHT